MPPILSGVRVVEYGGSAALRYSGHLLAALGAEVVRLPGARGLVDDVASLAPFAAYLDSGKTIAQGRGDDARNALIVGADVLLHDENSGVPSDRRGSANSGMIVVQVAADAAPGDLVAQHRGGIAFGRARPVADPRKQPPVSGAPFELSLALGVASATAAIAALLARRNRGGTGPQVALSMLEYCAYIGIEALAEWEAGVRTFERRRTGRTGVEVAGGSIWVLPCADGWIIASPREEHQWQRWIPMLGSPEWATDKKLCGDRKQRKTHWELIQQLMGNHTRQRTKAELFAAARAARVPCFPVSTIDDLFGNEQLAARGFFERLPFRRGAILVPGLPFHITTADQKQGAPIDE